MNPEIAKRILFKSEAEAKDILRSYKMSFRVTHRDGAPLEYLIEDRDDRRFSLIVEKGIVVRVYPG